LGCWFKYYLTYGSYLNHICHICRFAMKAICLYNWWIYPWNQRHRRNKCHISRWLHKTIPQAFHVPQLKCNLLYVEQLALAKGKFQWAWGLSDCLQNVGVNERSTLEGFKFGWWGIFYL
jgi:hypothetical protein